MKQKNLVISLPRLEPHRPPISTAIIAHAIELSGHPVDALDLNIEFFHYIGKEKYFTLDDAWDGVRDLTLSEYKTIIKFLQGYSKNFSDANQILISVFGSSARLFTHILCSFIKKHYKNKTIVLGGQGVIAGGITRTWKNFGDAMIESQLADHYISGEGEVAVVEYLEQNFDYPGINSANYKQIDELNNLPFPNYKYYDLGRYDYLDGQNKEVFVTSSRGCVRRCTYCDVARFWPKFRFRSGDNVANELIFHYENHGVNRFYFTDSLVNGSLKSFRDMCDKLAVYNQTHKANFKWQGQFIFRPKNQVPPEHFEMISQAGGHTFYVGVETGSDKVRWEMDKKFTNEDIDYQLEQFNKNNITVMFLMLMGYLTETQQDHQDTLNMFKRWQKYVATGTIVGIDLGVNLSFLQGTPLANMLDTHEVYFYDTGEQTHYGDNFKLWESKINPDLTIHERIRRRLETHEVAIKYNWPIWRGEQRLERMRLIAKDYKDYRQKTLKSQTELVDVNGVRFIKVKNIQ